MSMNLVSLPTPCFFVLVGVQAGKILIIRLGGWLFSRNPSPFPPQGEACGEITPRMKLSRTVSPCEFPPDRPGPRDDQPPQDDDQNFSSLNPMGSTHLFPNSWRQRSSLAQKLGVGKIWFILTILSLDPVF